ncbi:Metal-sulfur cluster biosynthetic enzyme [Natronorubrum sediminis]|uniref:Metal-sulfur cluster biosynthetic enzyme n=1 Tax=Natronorubrum sediminis TaxID=640943 RepID=A0A1H6G2A8_9EURY|nr:iron-sulfur cluster assembly protein [Natronorubrum sediminis]SEH17226.1 Metal-sulfur cluster biosynthetic enzyme [Natronorubrum sediminis]
MDDDRILERLDEIVDPCSAANGTDLSIVSMGLIEEIDIDGSHVTVSMHLTTPFCMQIPFFIDEVEDRVGSLEGVESVTLETDSGIEWSQDMMSEDACRKREQRTQARADRYRETASDRSLARTDG